MDFPRIFIVEDEKEIGHLLKTYLERERYRVDLAVDGVEALQKFGEINSSLLLLDLMLPGMEKAYSAFAKERKITLLLSSHILSEIEQLVDHLGIIHHGILLEEVEMDELRKRNRQYIEFHVSNEHKAAMLLEQHFHIYDYEVRNEGVIRVYSHFGERHELNHLFVHNDIRVSKMALSGDTLEDYFSRWVGDGAIG